MAADRPFDTTTPSSSQLTGPTAASGASPVAAGEKVASPLSTSSTSSTGVQTSRSEQSQAAQIWREFKKRKLAVCAAILMIVEIMIAVFAPFIANDRPMAFRGVNRFEFQQLIQTVESLMAMANGESRQESGAAKKVYPVLEKARSLLETAAAEIDVSTSNGSESHQQFEGLIRRIQDMQKPLGSFPDQTSALPPELIQGIQALLKDVKTLKKSELPPLLSRWYFPALVQLNGIDFWFIAAAIFWPVWWLTTRLWTFAYRQPRWLQLLVLAGVPTLAAGIWVEINPSRLDQTNYKQGVLTAYDFSRTAPVIFDVVVWPLVPFGIDEYDTTNQTQPPAFSLKEPQKLATPWDRPHWLGTNHNGVDLLTLLIWGARISLSVGLVAVLIYMSIGIVLGALAGYFRGWVDILISRLIEVVICFPTLFLVLTIVALLKPSLINIMIVIGLTGWTGVARLVRSEFLRLVNQEFVLAGKSIGFSSTRLIFRHILPNALAPVVVAATFGIAGAILLESSLSFLGLGVRVPTPSWGTILSEGRTRLLQAPWQMTYPGFAIFITVTCYNLIGEALRDAADPRLRGTR
ncbi:Glutathione transport system permease protein GsiD [Planctopirus ephydatiae]|uniref:Glutathione transport system permease protein GsiD n=1 Tax=Planctopirus ephydatiae TaxID=2528019 RepID=A0A518GNL7_9PLAN|nr:ABC transporter permease [Planctopirus ephydatiae]QDV30176.1 Glutathione transport system permease protein GsiD [Planctopirus ephydatiae]